MQVTTSELWDVGFKNTDYDKQLHMAANVSFFRRMAVAIQRSVLNGVLDPSFSFEEFLEGAKMAYVVIRQITSNVKDVSQLAVLEGMVRPRLLQVALFSS